MWNAIWKTRSSTINKKREVQNLPKIVDDQKTIPKHRLKGKEDACAPGPAPHLHANYKKIAEEI